MGSSDPLPTLHTVGSGERLIDLAEAYGFLPVTLWTHAENAALRDARHRPEGLGAGDVLFIPARRTKNASCATGKRHTFVRRGLTLTLRVQLVRYGEVLRERDVVIEPDVGAALTRRSDDDGVIEAPVSRQATRATLRIDAGTPREQVVQVRLRIDPWNAVAGAQQRLRNLGYRAVLPTGQVDARTFDATIDFQRRAGLNANGVLTDETLRALERFHDSSALLGPQP